MGAFFKLVVGSFSTLGRAFCKSLSLSFATKIWLNVVTLMMQQFVYNTSTQAIEVCNLIFYLVVFEMLLQGFQQFVLFVNCKFKM